MTIPGSTAFDLTAPRTRSFGPYWDHLPLGTAATVRVRRLAMLRGDVEPSGRGGYGLDRIDPRPAELDPVVGPFLPFLPGVQRLQPGEVLGRNQRSHGFPMSSQADPLAAERDPADEVGELAARLSDGNLTSHALKTYSLYRTPREESLLMLLVSHRSGAGLARRPATVADDGMARGPASSSTFPLGGPTRRRASPPTVLSR